MRSFSMSTKIWLSIGILVIGYFVSMVYGFVTGRQTEARLKLVSEYIFPAATNSQIAMTAFTEQISNYENVILFGDETKLQFAYERSREVREAIRIIASSKVKDDKTIIKVRRILKQLDSFTEKAQSVYSEMSMYDEEIGIKDEKERNLHKKAFNLASQTEYLRKELMHIKIAYADKLNAELADISRATMRQRYMNLIVFCTVVIIAVSMITAIITRSVIVPLRKTLMLEKAVEQSVDGIAVTTLDKEIEFVNSAWAKMHGYEPDELTGKHLKTFHTMKQYSEDVVPFNKNVLKFGMYEGEVGHVDIDGREFPTWVSTTLINDASGDSVGMVVIARDITLQKFVEDSLRESEKKYKILTEGHTDVVLRISKEGILEYISPAIKEFGGYEAEQGIGTSISKYFVNDIELEKAFNIIEEVLKGKKSDTLEFLFRAAKDKHIYVEVTATAVKKKNDEPALQCVMRNISVRKKVEKALKESLDELKSTQNQLVQSEKMAALGNLVAGVAHEINTPLGVGITAASHLSKKTDEYNDLYNSLKDMNHSSQTEYIKLAGDSAEIILKNLNRASDLVKIFKQVAVDQSTEMQRKFNLKAYINDLLFSLEPRYKLTEHSVEINCSEDLEINSFPGVFSQIITNFVMNSFIHGFDGIEKGEITFKIWNENDRLVFCYSDNGKGMDHEILDKVFDPFFTTNRAHGNTGLGMHIVYNLVTQKLGGSIEVTSTPGEGVFFLLRLPMTIITTDKLETGTG